MSGADENLPPSLFPKICRGQSSLEPGVVQPQCSWGSGNSCLRGLSPRRLCQPFVPGGRETEGNKVEAPQQCLSGPLSTTPPPTRSWPPWEWTSGFPFFCFFVLWAKDSSSLLLPAISPGGQLSPPGSSDLALEEFRGEAPWGVWVILDSCTRRSPGGQACSTTGFGIGRGRKCGKLFILSQRL